MVRRAAFCTLAVLTLAALALAQPKERTFEFTYAFSVRNPEQGKWLRVWFPKAHSDKYQSVRLISATGDLPLRQTHDSRGNEMFYAEISSATKPEYHFAAVYQVTRYERLGFEEIKDGTAAHLASAQLKQYLEPDRLVPVTGEPAQIAARVVQGKSNELAKARAIYDYIFSTMRYDKSGPGWGHGDAVWACNSKRGNCTDFHSLFAAMARSQGIPTRFSIGFPLPENEHEGEIPGYHCWAEFYLRGKGWIPVDISEAWQQPEKKNYFFGAHDDNRVQFTSGRDLTLSPRQDGPPLNYFVYPYAESDGKEARNIRNDFSFHDIEILNEAYVRH
jgi:transglutaminase-like putative cysteine protease